MTKRDTGTWTTGAARLQAAACLVLIAVLPVAIWSWRPMPPIDRLIDLSFFAGWHGFFLLCGLGAASARPSVWSGWDGRAHLWLHRALTYGLVGMLAAHVLAFVADQPQALRDVGPDAPWPMLAGLGASLAVGICLALSPTIRIMKALHANARIFRACHRFLAVAALALAFVHVAGARYHDNTVAKTWISAGCASLPLAVSMLGRLLPVKRWSPALKLGRGQKMVALGLYVVLCVGGILACVGPGGSGR